MGIIYKILGQINPIANSSNTIYTVPVGTNTVISTIAVCNQNANSSTFRVAVVPSGNTLSAQHYINYNTFIPANDTITLTIGVTMGAGDFLVANSALPSLSFSAFGSEIS